MAPIKEWFGLYNVIFNWFEEKYGIDALVKYWQHIAASCYNDVIKSNGLEGIRDYFDNIFDKDDGKYVSQISGDSLIYKVEKCPDFEFMNSSGNIYYRPIKDYCRHHGIINSIIAQKAGYDFNMSECSGQGRCTWMFKKIKNEEGKV